MVVGERQVTVETPLGTRAVAVDPADARQRWLFLAGATAFADYLDAQDGDYDPDLLADFIAYWLRPGEAGGRRLPSGRVLDDPVLLHIAARLGELPACTPLTAWCSRRTGVAARPPARRARWSGWRLSARRGAPPHDLRYTCVTY